MHGKMVMDGNKCRRLFVVLLLTVSLLATATFLKVLTRSSLPEHQLHELQLRVSPHQSHTGSIGILKNSASVSAATAAAATTARLPERYAERLRSLKINCAKYASELATRNSRVEITETMYADSERKFLYCCVPKVAGTSFRHAFLDVDLNNSFTQVHLMSASNQDEALKTYFKFMFVRHPFERLVSAYNSKFVESIPLGFIGRTVPYLYRRPTDNVTDEFYADKATFVEFVRYLLDPKTRQPFTNVHWRPFTDICQPCRIQYDFIGRYETLQDDAKFVLNKLGVKRFGKLNSAQRHVTSDVVDRYFSQLRRSDVEKLKEIYWLDFALFGYEY